MVSRILDNLRGLHERAGAHKAAWADATQVQPDGLTAFQQQAAKALTAAIPHVHLCRAGVSETFLVGSLPDQRGEVFIYEDQAEVKGVAGHFPGEHQDFASPAELIAAFLSAACNAGAP